MPVLIALLSFILPGTSPQDSPKTPVPSSAVQEDLLEKLRDLHRAEFARRDSAGKLALADALLAEAERTDAPPERFVLLAAARDLAAETGDVERAFKAVAFMEEKYDLPGAGAKGSATSTKLEVLATARKAPGKSREGRVAIAEAFVAVARQGLEAGDFDPAHDAAEDGVMAARIAGRRDLADEAKALVAEITAHWKAAKEVRAAELALSVDPEDPGSNLTVGRYYCFLKGDWGRGLPCLAKGSDPRLAEVAARERSAPEEAAEQAALGDAWYDLSRKERTDMARKRCLARAGHWYAKAIGQAEGLLKIRIGKRLDEIHKDSFSRAKLVLHLDFEGRERGMARDRSGSGHDAAAHGGAPHHPEGGRRGGVFRLNGTTDWLDVGRHDALKMEDVITVSAWIRPASLSVRMQNVLSDHAPAGNNGKILRLHGSRIEFLLGPEGSNGEVGATLPEADRWYHVVATYDGKTARFYLDGAPVDAKPRPGKITVNANPLLIGKSGFGEMFAGTIDDVMIFHRVLEDREVRQIHLVQGGR